MRSGVHAGLASDAGGERGNCSAHRAQPWQQQLPEHHVQCSAPCLRMPTSCSWACQATTTSRGSESLTGTVAASFPTKRECAALCGQCAACAAFEHSRCPLPNPPRMNAAAGAAPRRCMACSGFVHDLPAPASRQSRPRRATAVFLVTRVLVQQTCAIPGARRPFTGATAPRTAAQREKAHLHPRPPCRLLQRQATPWQD